MTTNLASEARARHGSGPQLPDWLRKRLARAMPADAVRSRFAPALSYGRHFGPAAHDARMAAVALVLYPKDGAWHVPFTVRPDTMLAHAGQISLPGGMIEPGEGPREAALRELEEELGVSRTKVEVLGSLSPLYVFASNFMVAPWVAVAREPLAFRPCDREVAAVLEIPLSHLVDPAHHGVEQYKRGELVFSAPHFAWQGHHIWGATSMILGELVAMLAEYPEAGGPMG